MSGKQFKVIPDDIRIGDTISPIPGDPTHNWQSEVIESIEDRNGMYFVRTKSGTIPLPKDCKVLITIPGIH